MSIINTEPASAEVISQFIALDKCSREELRMLSNHAWVDEVDSGHVITREGQSDNWNYFLIEGVISLQARGGSPSIIEAGSSPVSALIAPGQPRADTVSAQTRVRYLRIETNVLQRLPADSIITD